MQDLIDKELEFGSHIYSSLPVVFSSARGSHLYDTDGKQYIDLMSAYSAASLGHSNYKIIRALTQQVNELGVISRAIYNDKLPLFLEKICTLSKLDKAIPMNSGAEAVETAIKVARKWGHDVKGISAGEIIVAQNNFHGRTLAIISCSSEPQYQAGFAPLLTGFRQVPFNDSKALEEAINDKTIAFLVEPIQGEAGIIVPDENYITDIKAICRRYNILLILDEIQCGLSRTGALFCHRDATPDILILGKALGGGIYPVSCVVGRQDVMSVMQPGSHGSTFGGNPIASAIALSALEELSKPELIRSVEMLGKKSLDYLRDNLAGNKVVKDIRGQGLFIGVELTIPAKNIVKQLLEFGVVTKETHDYTIRIAPALNIHEKTLFEALNKIIHAIRSY